MTDAEIPVPQGAGRRLREWAGDVKFYGTDLVFLVVALLSTWVMVGELFGRLGGEGDGNLHLVIGHFIQPLGWASALAVVAATLYYSTKRSVLFGLSMSTSDERTPLGKTLRRSLDQHIVISVVALALAGLHILNFLGAIHVTTGWLTVGLMVLVAGSGIFGRFVATAPALRQHWRRFHLPYTALFFIVLTVHIVVKIGLVAGGGD